MSFVVDTFTNTNISDLASHTGETGATWTEHPTASTTIQIASNRAAPNGSNGVYTASGAPTAADYDVSADVYVASTTSAASGVIGRADATAATWYHARYNGATGNWELYKYVSGTTTLLGSYSQTLTVGNSYNVKLSMRGTSLTVYVDGVARITTTDSAITAAGKAGMRTNNGSQTVGYHLDNFTATDASGSTFIPRILA